MLSSRLLAGARVWQASRASPSSLAHNGRIVQKRTMLNFIKTTLGVETESSDEPTPENRFHPWETSPYQDLRARAASIKAHAKCPITGKEINYTCPISGIPTHHSREAWEQDVDYHKNKVYEKLRMANTYEHDLRSGREFPEFDFAGTQDPDKTVNFMNWDTFFYTRMFYSMDTEFQLAAVTKMMSYPVTIGGIMHEYSPYLLKPKGNLTLEGLKSLAALRYTLYPKDRNRVWQDRPMRVFILGARAESQLPPHVWKQLSYLFPYTSLEVNFIGPESNFDKEKGQYVYSSTPVTQKIDENLTLNLYSDYFHVLHEYQDFFPYDPYQDVFMLFHPGLGAPEAMDQWEKTIPGLLDSKCAIFSTGFHESDIQRDWDWLHEKFGDKFDVLLDKQDNVFGSTKWEVNDPAPSEVFQFNQKIFGFRGKRYHAIPK
ncbi:hypothetical protein NADFUDRAFT_48204 [Nadsonia fulvescens var. elongata DSM 6958]|uniref:Vps72/YL1 C-terminal domain-containing protein n=1 Tax=Nadsonia fulvescens var. elongata DSM 6958 TaxID=857566 RepID=A0A1E3PD38_9ASCO|nr:hypothetical protein NADFUDRAFT_48204 [Nadsonia fulvescens var. elongata DSM 6958]